MSSYKYKKHKSQEDGDPLTLNETTQIEMSTFPSAEENEESANQNEGANNQDLRYEEPNNVNQTNTHVSIKPCRVKTCYLIWGVVTTGLLVSLLMVAIIAHGSIRSIKWCCINQNELTKCNDMASVFRLQGLGPRVECVLKTSVSECVEAIDSDMADVMTMKSDVLYENRNKLKPILTTQTVAKTYGDEYGDVFVVSTHKNVSPDPKFTDKCNMSSVCFVQDDIIRHKDLLNSPNIIGNVVKKFANCKKNSHTSANFTSAYRECPYVFSSIEMLEIALKNNHVNESDIDVWCRNGETKSLKSYRDCVRLYKPTTSVVISNKLRQGQEADIPMYIVELLHVAWLYFGRSYEIYSNYSMFNSSRYNSKDLIFEDRTLKLVPLLPNCTAKAYLGPTYLMFEEGIKQVINETCFLREFYRPSIGVN